MPLDVWLAYSLAATVLLLIPGPTVLLVVSQSLAHGRRVVPSAVAGLTLGDIVALTASLLGLGAVLAASATLFAVLKWFGAAYLVWLAWRIWRGADQIAKGKTQLTLPQVSKSKVFRDAFIVTALNPKSIVFFVAFLPQFVDPAAAAWPQLLILGTTFVVLAAVYTAIYGYLAGSLRETLSSPRMMAGAQRVGAGFLFSAGVMTAAWTRSN